MRFLKAAGHVEGQVGYAALNSDVLVGEQKGLGQPFGILLKELVERVEDAPDASPDFTEINQGIALVFVLSKLLGNPAFADVTGAINEQGILIGSLVFQSRSLL